MAITITANDANGDSTGIDVTAYLATFVSPTYSPIGFGYFSSDPNDFSGNQYAVTEQPNLLPDTTKQAIVFESGGGGNSIEYDFATHIVGGDLDAISFGYGVTYSSGTDTFPLSQLDLRISGLGLVNQTGPGSTVEALLNDGRIASITNLSNLLASNAINFVGSTGADIFTGYALNDTLTGGGGNDTLNGSDGTDTAVYSGNKADYTITNNSGTWTITDNRAGTHDGVDTLTNVEFAQFADQTVALGGAPAASNDSASTGKNIKATIDVLANDTDSDGTIDPTTVAVGTGPAHGSVSISATTGVITYTPTAGYTGADSFTYTVKDNDGNVSNAATVIIDVAAKLTLTSADEAFVGDLKAIGAVEVDGSGGADYLSGSNAVPSDDIFYGGEGNDVLFGGPGNDRLEGNAGDDILRSGSGTDTLIGGTGTDTYGIRIFRNVSSATTDSGTVTITDDDGILWNGTIRPSPMPSGWPAGQQPAATAGFQIAGTATVVTPGVWDLAVTDDSGATKHLAINWSGHDLTMTGGNETVIIKDYVNGTFGITLENAAAVAANDSASTGKNIKATIDVLANDTDVDGTIDPTTVAVGTGPAHGSVSISATTGIITYTPTAGYTGADSFTYTVKDNDGAVSSAATVNIDVTAKLTLTAADEAFVGDLKAIGAVEVDGSGGADYLSGSNAVPSDDIFYGGEGNDVLFGGPGNDRLEGNAGDDILRSGSGNDELIGGTGTDTYGIRIFRNVSSATTDSGTVTITDDDGILWNGTIRPNPMPSGWPAGQQPAATAGFQIAGTATAASAGGWDLAVTDDSGATKHLAINWSGHDLTMTGGNETVIIKDYVNGTFGITLDHVLTGDSGNNSLSGAGGIYTMLGRAGDDTYVVDDAGDQVVENANEGNDLVNASVSFILGANVENLTLTGSGNINGTGNGLTNSLTGNSGDNVLDGQGGSDTMAGGAGNDSYYIDVGSDIVTENANEGTDTVYSLTHYQLTANVENLVLLGTADLQGYGNALNNTLTGNSGANLLDGAVGVDIMIGGAGNDVYFVDSGIDAVIENANEGIDTVYSTDHLVLGNNVENLILVGGDLQGYGNSLNNVLTGTDGANLLDGRGGVDLMIGGKDNDVYFVDSGVDGVIENLNEGFDTVYSTDHLVLGDNVENLILVGGDLQGYGNSLSNVLTGTDGANLLDGRGGTDQMIGGKGNDAYFVDVGTDAVFENANEGLDIVFSTDHLVLADNVEYLKLMGSADLQGYGNTLDNILYGNSGANLLDGGQGNDTLDGGAGTDYLVGNTGNDTFVFYTAEANGDAIADFEGNGAAAGDSLQFYGFGTAAQGATFTQVGSTSQWQIHSGLDNHNEIITLIGSNGSSVHPSDYTFFA